VEFCNFTANCRCSGSYPQQFATCIWQPDKLKTMDSNFNTILLHWASILMLTGGLAFLIGAFIPPYKQWMTSDLKEYLIIINSNRTNWYLIHSPMLIGVIATIFALQLFSNSVTFTSNGTIYSTISSGALLFGAVFLVVNFAFRLTVTLWAAQRLAETGEIDSWFKTWMDWSNLLFAIYMVLAYISLGFFGLALREISFIPSWLIWFCMLYGFCGSIGYIIRIPIFAPPVMIHFPFIISGLLIILKLKSYL
jgi:hypothetical protein